MVQQNFSAVLLFNGKVGDVNTYSVILVTNSYGESWDSSCEKYWVPVQKHRVPGKKKKVCDWKCVGLCVTRQLIWLISLTDSKTLYYCSTKSKSMPSQSKSVPFFSTIFIHFNIRSPSANHDGLTMLLSDLQH